MIKKILVGIDDSKYAEKALRRALDVQKKYGSDLVVFHSIEHKMIPKYIKLPRIPFGPSKIYEIPENDYIKLRQEYLNKGEEIIKKAEKLIDKRNKNVVFELIKGIKPEVYAISKSKNFDLILMGKKGDHNALEKRFGSVAEDVMENSDCIVMLVK
ncbi:MAG: universal stress protein [Promethearchaeota archaeon]|nr:MAG: universal stress protein [Candidatus Lokiarchaeota archaeon]